jgi:hypothetical protein
MELRRAEAMMRLTEALAEGLSLDPNVQSQQLIVIQEQFYQACRLAANGISQNPSISDGEKRSGRDLHSRLQALVEQNKQIAMKFDFEKVRAEAEKKVQEEKSSAVDAGFLQGSFSFGTGYPVFLFAENSVSFPELTLRSTTQTQTKRAWILTLIVMATAAGIWLASFSRRLVEILSTLWPEQLALVGILSYVALGYPSIFAGLLLLGLASRLFIIGRRCLGWVI